MAIQPQLSGGIERPLGLDRLAQVQPPIHDVYPPVEARQSTAELQRQVTDAQVAQSLGKTQMDEEGNLQFDLTTEERQKALQQPETVFQILSAKFPSFQLGDILEGISNLKLLKQHWNKGFLELPKRVQDLIPKTEQYLLVFDEIQKTDPDIGTLTRYYLALTKNEKVGDSMGPKLEYNFSFLTQKESKFLAMNVANSMFDIMAKNNVYLGYKPDGTYGIFDIKGADITTESPFNRLIASSNPKDTLLEGVILSRTIIENSISSTKERYATNKDIVVRLLSKYGFTDSKGNPYTIENIGTVLLGEGEIKVTEFLSQKLSKASTLKERQELSWLQDYIVNKKYKDESGAVESLKYAHGFIEYQEKTGQIIGVLDEMYEDKKFDIKDPKTWGPKLTALVSGNLAFAALAFLLFRINGDKTAASMVVKVALGLYVGGKVLTEVGKAADTFTVGNLDLLRAEDVKYKLIPELADYQAGLNKLYTLNAKRANSNDSVMRSLDNAKIAYLSGLALKDPTLSTYKLSADNKAGFVTALVSAATNGEFHVQDVTPKEKPKITSEEANIFADLMLEAKEVTQGDETPPDIFILGGRDIANNVYPEMKVADNDFYNKRFNAAIEGVWKTANPEKRKQILELQKQLRAQLTFVGTVQGAGGRLLQGNPDISIGVGMDNLKQALQLITNSSLGVLGDRTTYTLVPAAGSTPAITAGNVVLKGELQKQLGNYILLREMQEHESKMTSITDPMWENLKGNIGKAGLNVNDFLSRSTQGSSALRAYWNGMTGETDTNGNIDVDPLIENKTRYDGLIRDLDRWIAQLGTPEEKSPLADMKKRFEEMKKDYNDRLRITEIRIAQANAFNANINAATDQNIVSTATTVQKPLFEINLRHGKYTDLLEHITANLGGKSIETIWTEFSSSGNIKERYEFTKGNIGFFSTMQALKEVNLTCPTTLDPTQTTACANLTTMLTDYSNGLNANKVRVQTLLKDYYESNKTMIFTPLNRISPLATTEPITAVISQIESSNNAKGHLNQVKTSLVGLPLIGDKLSDRVIYNNLHSIFGDDIIPLEGTDNMNTLYSIEQMEGLFDAKKEIIFNSLISKVGSANNIDELVAIVGNEAIRKFVNEVLGGDKYQERFVDAVKIKLSSILQTLTTNPDYNISSLSTMSWADKITKYNAIKNLSTHYSSIEAKIRGLGAAIWDKIPTLSELFGPFDTSTTPINPGQKAIQEKLAAVINGLKSHKIFTAPDYIHIDIKKIFDIIINNGLMFDNPNVGDLQNKNLKDFLQFIETGTSGGTAFISYTTLRDTTGTALNIQDAINRIKTDLGFIL